MSEARHRRAISFPCLGARTGYSIGVGLQSKCSFTESLPQLPHRYFKWGSMGLQMCLGSVMDFPQYSHFTGSTKLAFLQR